MSQVAIVLVTWIFLGLHLLGNSVTHRDTAEDKVGNTLEGNVSLTPTHSDHILVQTKRVFFIL